MRKPKPLPFKKGDEVIYINLSYGLKLTKAVVTATRNDKGIVYVNSISENGWVCKESFGRECGKFQENPRPLWMLRHLNGENFSALEKRAKHARKVYEQCQEAFRQMEIQLEEDTRAWKRREYDKRTAKLTS